MTERDWIVPSEHSKQLRKEGMGEKEHNALLIKELGLSVGDEVDYLFNGRYNIRAEITGFTENFRVYIQELKKTDSRRFRRTVSPNTLKVVENENFAVIKEKELSVGQKVNVYIDYGKTISGVIHNFTEKGKVGVTVKLSDYLGDSMKTGTRQYYTSPKAITVPTGPQSRV